MLTLIYRMLSVYLQIVTVCSVPAKKQNTRLFNESNVQTMHKGKIKTNLFDVFKWSSNNLKQKNFGLFKSENICKLA